MKINIAKSAGLCFGVKRAIAIALNAPKKGLPVYMLGDIVHNEDVVKLIEHSGIKKIKKISKVSGGLLLIRAHGSSKEILDKAHRMGYRILDATCPMVKEIHKIVMDMDKKGYRIIVIGDHKHDEVQGIIGQIENKAIVLEDIGDINKSIPQRIKKACIVVQSTQNQDKVIKIFKVLKKLVSDLRFYNTICSPTKLKQTEIKNLPKNNDCVIVIGSKTSANTKRLYEIAKSINKNSHWVSSKNNIKKDWFKNVKSVGITAGASTPDKTINSIKDYIQRM